MYRLLGSHHPRHLHSWSRSNDKALTHSYTPQEDPLSQLFDANSIHFTNTSLTSPSFCGIQYSQFQKRCCYTHLSLDTASVTSAWQSRYCQSVPPLYQYSCWYHHHCYCSTCWVLASIVLLLLIDDTSNTSYANTASSGYSGRNFHSKKFQVQLRNEKYLVNYHSKKCSTVNKLFKK